MKFIKRTAAVLALSAAMLSGPVQAVPVTVVGTTVSFTFDSALSGLFGVPMVTGDALFFTPTTYKAQSFNGTGFAAASQTFNITFYSGPGGGGAAGGRAGGGGGGGGGAGAS